MDTDITGNVDLSSPTVVETTKIEPWIKDNKPSKPMPAANVEILNKAIGK